MQYSYSAKNSDKDLIFITRLKLIHKLKINPFKSSKMYSYFIDAYLGIILY